MFTLLKERTINPNKFSYIVLFILFFENFLNYEVYLNAFDSTAVSKGHYLLHLLILMLTIFSFFTIKRIVILCVLVLMGFLQLPITYGVDLLAFNLVLISFFLGDFYQNEDYYSKLGKIILVTTLVIIYLYNGISKCLDPAWLNGYVLPILLKNHLGYELKTNLILIGKLFSYIIILIQFLSPLLFFSKTRKYVSGLNICIHMGIAVFMHPYMGLLCVCLNLYTFFIEGNIFKGLWRNGSKK